jgi:hypothetical protein
MPSERCLKWEPVPEIQSACSDISFELNSRDQLGVTMHFSFMRGQPKRDLHLTFAGPVSLRWVQEAFDSPILKHERTLKPAAGPRATSPPITNAPCQGGVHFT